MTDRDTFCAVLSALPLTRADAIVVLTGDGLTRVPTVVELFRQQAAPVILVAGGVDAPPFALPADRLRDELIRAGVHPDAVRVEPDSQHTAESAHAVCAIAKFHGWRRVLLVTSAYHMPRAMLSFVAALKALGLDEVVQIVPVAAVQPWCDATDRLGLLHGEREKVTQYAGDVASYDDGLAYLLRWERAA